MSCLFLENVASRNKRNYLIRFLLLLIDLNIPVNITEVVDNIIFDNNWWLVTSVRESFIRASAIPHLKKLICCLLL